MSKNILIFSDGTGQRSGERFDENRTNIYKLYRATKSGPDSSVDPRRQHAYYDPGIGTIPPLMGIVGALWAKLYNLLCQATGLGLTRNIEDCYEAILRVYEPGDRIFLFGFSRGAYTVRCLAAVLHFCGVPTRGREGRPLTRDRKTLKRLSSEAVEAVYQHVTWAERSKRGEGRYLEQRRLLGARFRKVHASVDAYPHFIGVFDTVATVGNTASLILSAVIGAAVVTALSGLLGWWLGGFTVWFATLTAAGLVGGLIYYVWTHFKVAFGLEGHPWWDTAHLNPIRMRFYDTTLNTRVGWARHALAIDEHRADFDRVPWGNTRDERPVEPGEPNWLEQIWFAGNHADIGGGYPEPESRLSDAALQWMVSQARSIPEGMIVDESVLKTYSSADGMQHDETKPLEFRFAKKILRGIPQDVRLDPLVAARMKLDAVLHLYEMKAYRPENLRKHGDTSNFFAET